ncbi:OsmC family protein [Glutamicibacter endophyticus]
MSSNLSTVEDRAARLLAAGEAWGERITDNPEHAKLTFAVSGAGFGAVASKINAGKHSFIVDEPAALGGDDAAASPVEYALGALISCQVVVYRLYAQQLGVRVDDVQITATGRLDVRGLFAVDNTVRPGFSDIEIEVTVAGPDSDARYAELQRTVDRYCPVLDLLSNPTPVNTSLKVTR